MYKSKLGCTRQHCTYRASQCALPRSNFVFICVHPREFENLGGRRYHWSQSWSLSNSARDMIGGAEADHTKNLHARIHHASSSVRPNLVHPAPKSKISTSLHLTSAKAGKVPRRRAGQLSEILTSFSDGLIGRIVAFEPLAVEEKGHRVWNVSYVAQLNPTERIEAPDVQ